MTIAGRAASPPVNLAPPSAWQVRLSIEIVSLSSDGRARGKSDERSLFQIRDESDASLVERGRLLLGVLRARAIAVDEWKRDASRLSLRTPWPIPAYFSAEGADHRAEISLRVTLETKNARAEDEDVPLVEDEPLIYVTHSEFAPLATPRLDRIRRYVELAHAAIRHEVDECLFVDDRRAHDPHEPPGGTAMTGPRKKMTGTTHTMPPASAELDPDQIARPRSVAKLTIAIERPDQEILAEDFITQATDESDQHFIARAAIVLEFLRLQSGIPPAPKDSAVKLRDAWPGLPRVGLERSHLDRLEIMTRIRTDLGDAVLAGLLTVYGLHGKTGVVQPKTMSCEVLRRYVSLRDASAASLYRYPADAEADLAAVSALIAALEEHERIESPPREG